MELVHALPHLASAPEESEPDQALNTPPLSLSRPERHALAMLGSAEDASLEAQVLKRGSVLAAESFGATRREVLARAAALTEAELTEYRIMLAGAVAQRDKGAIKIFDRLLSSATKRLAVVAQALRAESLSNRKPPVVLVNQADQVNIRGR